MRIISIFNKCTIRYRFDTIVQIKRPFSVHIKMSINNSFFLCIFTTLLSFDIYIYICNIL